MNAGYPPGYSATLYCFLSYSLLLPLTILVLNATATLVLARLHVKIFKARFLKPLLYNKALLVIIP